MPTKAYQSFVPTVAFQGPAETFLHMLYTSKDLSPFDSHNIHQGGIKPNNLPLPTLVESSAQPLQFLKLIMNRDTTCYSHKPPLQSLKSTRSETLLVIPTSNPLAYHLYQLHITRINFGPRSPWFNTANTMCNCLETTITSWLPKRDLEITSSPAGFTSHHCLHPGNLFAPCFQQSIEILTIPDNTNSHFHPHIRTTRRSVNLWKLWEHLQSSATIPVALHTLSSGTQIWTCYFFLRSTIGYPSTILTPEQPKQTYAQLPILATTPAPAPLYLYHTPWYHQIFIRTAKQGKKYKGH